MTKLSEASAIWSEAPRYCPDLALPPYRFTPGFNYHPRRHPEGHAYGLSEPKLSLIPPEQWQQNPYYLFGVDLYHQGFFWEAHEAWELLWHLTGKQDQMGQFLQGLIQNSAAQLKRHIGQWSGMAHLGSEAYRRLYSVIEGADASDYMGLDLKMFLVAMQAHYGPVWQNKTGAPKLVAPVPLMKLKFD